MPQWDPATLTEPQRKWFASTAELAGPHAVDESLAALVRRAWEGS